MYKNEFFTYACNSPGHNAQFEITDSTFIWYDLEGPQVSKLIKPELLKNKLSLNTFGRNTNDINSFEIIDNEKGIAIFTNYSKFDKTTYKYLLVDSKKVSLFRIIVDYCEEEEECDFVFDKIDFDKLRKSYSQH